MTAPPSTKKTTGAIKVLLADDHEFLRRSLRLLLESDEELELIGEAADVAAAVREVHAQEPNVLVLDIGMPTGAILGVIRELRARAPATALVLTTLLDDPRFARATLAAGASGFVLTDAADRDLGAAIRAAADGGSFVSPELSQLLRVYESVGDGLTARELEVLRFIGLGHTNSEIGELLGLSVRTVESHRAGIHRKLGLGTRAELVRYALRLGLLSAELDGAGTVR
jgi:two-component system response regulator NreC